MLHFLKEKQAFHPANIKTVLKNSNDETYDYIIDYIIEYIINQYNIESNIDLDIIESNKQIYKYQINMKLK